MRTEMAVRGTADAFGHYLEAVRRYPLLEAEAERDLMADAQALRAPAVRKLIGSHLRLVIKIARGFGGYGLPLADLVAAGNLGLMRAVKGFDPARGFRFATYATWWIRAEIQEFVLQSWSLVRIAKTTPQKRLFFNLRRTKARLKILESGDLAPADIKRIAEELSVPSEEVVSMQRRLIGGDLSLSAPCADDSEDSWEDRLVDERVDQETSIGEHEQTDQRRALLQRALAVLDEREHAIFVARRLREEPLTLEALAQRYGISRERVRQLEVRAFKKIRLRMAELSEQTADTGAVAPAARRFAAEQRQPAVIYLD
ncbi:MAG TPA: RNA polymerase factor sigma-32 [Stellaceae bacterium]|nr:RNA polymerase factor sigma-32 [Stellaceae bacterium]